MRVGRRLRRGGLIEGFCGPQAALTFEGKAGEDERFVSRICFPSATEDATVHEGVPC